MAVLIRVGGTHVPIVNFFDFLVRDYFLYFSKVCVSFYILIFWQVSLQLSIRNIYIIEAEWRIYASVNISSLVDNGLLPGRLQAIIWTNAGVLLIQTLGTNFGEILSEIHTFSFKEMQLKMSSAKMAGILSWPRCVKWYSIGNSCLDNSKNWENHGEEGIG